jgi:redox-sensitive bicupin YhaK (pirin superfamily)
MKWESAMIRLRPSAERGRARLDWLDTRHSFSFGDYYDPRHMGVSNLRVLNDDTIAPGGGFPTHGHKDMEIVTYILAGALAHKDSMGNGSVILPGDVQHMSAGTGVRHSEYNASDADPVRLLQIWLVPNRLGIRPGYHQQHFAADERRGRLALLVSPDGRDGSIPTQQDALMYATILAPDRSVRLTLETGREAYVHVARGQARISGTVMGEGDGAHLTGDPELLIYGVKDAEVLVFDLP